MPTKLPLLARPSWLHLLPLTLNLSYEVKINLVNLGRVGSATARAAVTVSDSGSIQTSTAIYVERVWIYLCGVCSSVSLTPGSRFSCGEKKHLPCIFSPLKTLYIRYECSLVLLYLCRPLRACRLIGLCKIV